MIVYRTSKVYPQVAEDRVGVVPSPGYGNLGPSLTDLAQDPVAVTATIVSGSLRSLLRGLNVVDAAVVVTPSLVSGELRTALGTTSIADDRAQVGAAVVGGTLRQARFTYSDADDVATVSASIVSGSLA